MKRDDTSVDRSFCNLLLRAWALPLSPTTRNPLARNVESVGNYVTGRAALVFVNDASDGRFMRFYIYARAREDFALVPTKYIVLPRADAGFMAAESCSANCLDGLVDDEDDDRRR
jgi:hypothetical protein